MAEGAEVFRIALEQLKQGALKKEEFLAIATSDLSLRQANIEEALEKQKQEEADERCAKARLAVKVLKGTDMGQKSGQRKERGLYVKVKFGREEQRTPTKRCKHEPIWGSSSPAMKFNYNPNNLGLLPDIMSFEVWTDNFLMKDRMISSGRLHIATALASGDTPTNIEEPEPQKKTKLKNFGDSLLGSMKAALHKSDSHSKANRHLREATDTHASASATSNTNERAVIKRMDRDAVQAWKKAVSDKDPQAIPDLTLAFKSCLDTFQQAIQHDSERVLAALPPGNLGTAVIRSERLSEVECTDVYFRFDFPFLVPPGGVVARPPKLDIPVTPKAVPEVGATTIGNSNAHMPRHHSVPLMFADASRGRSSSISRSSSTSRKGGTSNDSRRSRSSGALEVLLYLETDPAPGQLLHEISAGSMGLTPKVSNSNTKPMQMALQQFADNIITQEEFVEITEKDLRMQQRVARQNSKGKTPQPGEDESEVMQIVKMQLREGTITQEEYETIVATHSAYELAQEQAQEEEAEESIKKSTSKKMKAKTPKPPAPSEPKQYRMNTAEGDAIDLAEFVEHATLLDTVVNGGVRLKMQAESAKAAIDNMAHLKKIVNGMGWGVDLKELKKECLEFFEAKSVHWTEKVEGMLEQKDQRAAQHGAKFRAFRHKLRLASCIRKQDEKIDPKYLLKLTKAIRENFFPREAPIFEGRTYEGEYKDLLELLAWSQIRKGAKTSTAFACADYLPLIASRDEVMELAAKIATLLHSDCTDINLFNRVSATPIVIKASARTIEGQSVQAAMLESQTKEVLRFIKGPPTLELDVLEDSWIVTVNLVSSVTLADVEAAPLIERRFQVSTDNEMMARLFARPTSPTVVTASDSVQDQHLGSVQT